MIKNYRTVPVDEAFGTLSAERLARIKDRAADLIAEEFGQRKQSKSKPLEIE